MRQFLANLVRYLHRYVDRLVLFLGARRVLNIVHDFQIKYKLCKEPALILSIISSRMSSPGRTPLLNLSNKRRKSTQGSARSRGDKDKIMKEKQMKERTRDIECKAYKDSEMKIKAALKEACLENDIVVSPYAAAKASHRARGSAVGRARRHRRERLLDPRAAQRLPGTLR